MIGKYAQRRLYDAINRPPIYCFVAVTVATFFLGFMTHMTIFRYLHDGSGCKNMVPWWTNTYIGKAHNIDISRYISTEPIDVVYTWVNGSDIPFLESLERHLILSGRGTTAKLECKLDRCVPFAAMLFDETLAAESSYVDCLRGDEATLVEEEGDSGAVFVVFPKIRNETRCSFDVKSHVAIKSACLTSSVIYSPSAVHPLAFYISLITRLGNFKDERSLREALPSAVGNHISDLRLNINEDFAMLLFPTEESRENAEKSMHQYLALHAQFASILPVFIVDCEEFVSNSPNRLEAKPKRFIDNDELRYSLRSLDQYAPWVRHVYLVTNGQIPSWLNLDNPHLTMITHEDIFGERSASVLPTFSSPSIESQMFKIPNLSEHFIYFNDDFFLGQSLYPEDFITRSTGQKFYLTYSLPNCATGCPHTWIRDGFCDRPCNNSDCDFDGGDCQMGGNATTPNIPLHPIDFQLALERAYCSNGCSNAWVADGFCDAFCNVASCAFDAGDCGIGGLMNPVYNFFVFNAVSNRFTVEVTKQQFIAIGNFSAIIPDDKAFKIGKCSTPETPALRTSSFIASHSLFVLMAFRNISKEDFTAECELTFADAISIHFNVSFSTFIPPITSIEAELPRKTKPAAQKRFRMPTVYSVNASQSIFERLMAHQKYYVMRLCPRLIPAVRRLLFQFHNKELTYSGLGLFLDELRGKNKTCLFGEFITIIIEKSDENVVAAAAVATTVTESLRITSSGGTRLRRRAPGLTRQQQSSSVMLSRFRPRSLNLANVNSSAHQENLPPDAYSGSLLHVNRLLNRDFGYAQRRIPAHAPLLIQRTAFEELYSRYRTEWLATSSRRFRSSEDMQLQFSYMYYIMSATLGDSSDSNEVVANIFTEEIDVDQSGDLNAAELRTLLTRAHISRDTGVSSLQSWRRFADSLVRHGCFENLTEFSAMFSNVEDSQTEENKNVRKVTLSDAKQCNPLRELFLSIAKHRSKYKFEALVADEDSTVFRMLQSNVLLVETWLNSLRRRPPKFFCLNDDMDHSEPLKPETEQIITNFKTFLSESFPRPSQFELPRGFRNRFETVAALRHFRAEESRRKAVYLYAFVVVTVALIVLCLFRWGHALRKIWCKCFDAIFSQKSSTATLICGSVSVD